MRKRFLSLLCVLALCLTLLPATALAAENAPTTLYVGNYQITNGNATTYLKAGSTQGSLVEGRENDWTVKYDPSTATLTLNGATITGNDNISSVPYGAGIYAQCNSGQPVTLTIELIGENTITGNFGIYVNAEMSANSYGTDASLTITGENNGSLKVSGSYHGIYVKSGTGDASLNINDASVVASSSSSYSGYAGVYVQSSVHTTSSPQLSLKVNGGSLTASGTGSSGGIQFHVGWDQATGATTNLTVTDNAIVDARNGGISASRISETLPTPTPTGNNSSGIVFDGTEGTVYGDVTLEDNLTIGEDESLTIPDGASLNTGSHEVIVNGGTLTGGDKITGTVKYAPAITTKSLPNGTVGTAYSQTLAATGSDTSTWSIESGSLPAGLSLNESTGEITGTPTAAGTSTFTVKANNNYGSDSKSLSITISAQTNVPVTGVSLNKTELTLTEGNIETLTATITPDNATNKNVTWSSDTPSVASVNNGVVTAVAPGTATITVTTEDGSKTATCAVTVKAATVSVTGVTLSQTQASLYSNRTPNTLTLTATVAPDDATNKAVTWTSSDSTVATVDQNGVVTAVAPGTATITVTTAHGSFTATCTVTVSRYSSGGGSSSRPTPSLSDQAIDKIEDARPGDTVEITLRPGRTTLEREVFESLAGQNITLEIDAGDGVLWTVNGLDIPEDTRLHDLDLDVDLGDSDIPARVINAVTGTVDTVQLSLKHDGEFGFTMALSAPLGRENADLWANLYWYNERSEELEFQQAVRIGRDGTAEFALDHASDYAIVIDTDSHEPVELPFRDVPKNAWYADAAAYVYKHGLMAGTSATTFAPDMTTSRAMIGTILWRLAGSPQVDYLMDYSDVDPTAYYGEAIRWATSEGIAGGYGGGVFGPDDPITREQLATMLWRYAQTEDYDVSVGEDTNILSYTDAFDVAEYGIPAMQWACGAGVINGTGDGSTLSPQGEATRAQAAVMLMRFCEEYVTW